MARAATCSTDAGENGLREAPSAAPLALRVSSACGGCVHQGTHKACPRAGGLAAARRPSPVGGRYGDGAVSVFTWEHVAEDDEALRPAAGHGDPRPDPRHCDLNRGRALAEQRVASGAPAEDSQMDPGTADTGVRRRPATTASGRCGGSTWSSSATGSSTLAYLPMPPLEPPAAKAREPRARRGGTRTPGLGAARRPRPGPAPWAKSWRGRRDSPASWSRSSGWASRRRR